MTEEYASFHRDAIISAAATELTGLSHTAEIGLSAGNSLYPTISSRPSSPKRSIESRSVESRYMGTPSFADDSLRLIRADAHASVNSNGAGRQPQINLTESRFGVDWRSMTFPACLPLTTSKPLKDVFNEAKYEEAPHPMQNFDDETIDSELETGCQPVTHFMNKRELFYELTNQRLSQVEIFITSRKGEHHMQAGPPVRTDNGQVLIGGPACIIHLHSYF